MADEVTGPNGQTYLVPKVDNTGVADPNVTELTEFGDNKVLRKADGTFDPTFAPEADNYTFDNQRFLTLPRRNFAFTDIIGRNHTCATYGLTQGACSGGGSPPIGFLGTGDLVPGVQNFAAILRGFVEFVDTNGDFVPDPDPTTGETRPGVPYGVLCENCGGVPYVPIAEFFVDNGDGSVTQSIAAGTYGEPVADPYKASIVAATATDVKEDVIPEPEPGGPCDPLADPDSRKPSCEQLRTSATGQFHDMEVVPGAGINGGDAVEFTIDVTNTSSNPAAYLTAFNYQTKRRGLADIGILDGFTQDRRDIRVDSTRTPCTTLADEACYNAALGIGHFPNVIGNGLLFGQMVWPDASAGREEFPVDSDQVFVDTEDGIAPTESGLESVKKNGPFTPILKGATNFICVKSGLFDLDPDADAGCTGQPAILADEDGALVPGNITQRLGLPAGQTQQVRMRMEYGDFRGAMLKIVAGTLNPTSTEQDLTATQGLARFFDCSDQRELEFCHPDKVGDNIGYLPNTDANWMTPATLEEIEYVIINQPGDAPTVMNFQQNLGSILAMAGFVPSAEFYAPDPNPDLIGTPDQGILIRQQVLGTYETTTVPAAAPTITSTAVTTATAGQPYSYDVNATAFPGPITYSLDVAPNGMTIDGGTGVISWSPGSSGVYDVAVRASNGTEPDAVEAFQVNVATVVLDDFNRADGPLGANWKGATFFFRIAQQQADVNLVGGPIYWKTAFGPDQEAAMTLTKIDPRGQHGLALKLSVKSNKFNAIMATYDARGKRILVTSFASGKKPKVLGTYRVTLADGDRLGARALPNGTVTVTVNGKLVGIANAGKAFVNKGGHVGALFLLAPGATFDDFGGGDVTP